MKEEMLPVLEERNGRINIVGTVSRPAAHDPSNPVLHATAVIVAVLPDGRILFADKTKKQLAKGRLPEGTASGFHVIDIFGGHLSSNDLTSEDFLLGMQETTFRKCALRELSEELLTADEQGGLHPLAVEESRLSLIGYYRMENDHNRELSMAYLYRLPGKDHYASVDTLTEEGRETIFSQPLIYLPADSAVEAYFSLANPASGAALRITSANPASGAALKITSANPASGAALKTTSAMLNSGTAAKAAVKAKRSCSDASHAEGFVFDDAFGRIVQPDRGQHLLQLINRATRQETTSAAADNYK